MRILFLANNGARDPASRTRVFQYLPLFRERGIDPDVEVVVADSVFARSIGGGHLRALLYYVSVVWLSFRAGVRTLVRASCYDSIFIQRVLFPFPIPFLLRRYRRKIVYDFDDAIFTTEATHATGLERVRKWFHERSLAPVLRAAAHAVVENDYTGAYAERCGATPTVITGPIDTGRYRTGVKKRETAVVLGWIGSPSTVAYLDLIRRPLETLGERYPDLVLRVIGASGPRLRRLKVEERSWSLETEVDDLRTFDIGLMPLPDDPWTRGKGGYKILQYSSMGLPVVASPVGVNAQLVDDEVSGFLAGTDEEWVCYLSRLISDSDLRNRVGREGRSRMESIYALDRAADRLVGLFSTVCGRKDPLEPIEKRT